MKFFQNEIPTSKNGDNVIILMTREEGKKMVEVYEYYAKNHPRQKKVKQTWEQLHHSLPVW